MAFLIVLLVVSTLTIYFFLQKKKKAKQGSFFVSTEGQNRKRIQKLQLNKPSEDASYLLDDKRLSFPRGKIDFENMKFKPDPDRTWIIDIIAEEGALLKKDDLWALFDKDWRTDFPAAEVYGYSTKKRWAHVIDGSTSDRYTKIQAGIDLLGVYNDKEPDYDPAKLEKYITALKERITTSPVTITTHPAESIEQAIARARQLNELYHAFNKDVILILKNESFFEGAAAWDVLLSAGLTWGDGDLFHWRNHGKQHYGNDRHFSVWSSGNPGYFFPENIKKTQFDDLIFSFSIPRSADPQNVFEVMLNTIRYCGKRLTGTVLNRNGLPLNEQEERKYIADLVNNMRLQEMIPGSGKALRLYLGD